MRGGRREVRLQVREFGEDLACGTLAAIGMFAHTAILTSDFVEVVLTLGWMR